MEALLWSKMSDHQCAGECMVGSPTEWPGTYPRNHEKKDRPDQSKGCKRHKIDKDATLIENESRLEFEIGDRVFDAQAKVGKVAYKLELPQELSRVHHTFHVSNLKKCYADEPLVMPLEGIHVDDKLQFMVSAS
ncbi:hypothetical protein Tco_0993140 [Tanacetum coccineum]|uniref:Tf2-1-like SH3-like domain-containing protein n=1 Tax=Tanacetum coccineum TaxID=301880 RepID=A0ABQ5F417_9ASTR